MDFFGKRTESDDKKMKDDSKRDIRDTDERKMKLRKEELDIDKKKFDVGKVEFGKEIIEEKQTISVPVTHEEVVIERKSVNERSDKPIRNSDEEHFTIPLSEEEVKVGKHTVVTDEISARKRQIEENHEVTETMKREEARISKDGQAKIVDDIDKLE